MDQPAPAANTAELKANAAGLARQRLFWLIRPLGFLAVLLWVLSPGTADRVNLQPQILLGFLFGALYGVLFYAEEFRKQILLQYDLGRERHNRLPEEYYFGSIEQIRVKWGK
jgi:hypothetical protein